MATDSNNDKLSYGLVLLIFGVLFLLDKIGILAQIPINYNFLSVSAFFLIAGIVFIITQPRRPLSWVFMIIGIFLNSNLFFGWLNAYSKYYIPLALIIVGLFMVFSSKKK